MLLFPLAVMGNNSNIGEKIAETSVPQEIQAVNVDAGDFSDSFRVYDKKEDKITELSANEYIFGVVAAEMPALYESEALKAQAVAAYTYACYKRNQNKEKNYDITTDYTVDQSFKSREKALKDWGSKGKDYEAKIDAAVKATLGEYLSFDGKPILAVYHAISSGRTNSAKTIWGKEIAYLKSVPSEGDKLVDNYISKVTLSESQLLKKLENSFEFETSEEEILEVEQREGNTVKTLKLYGKTVSGGEIRSALGLASQNFEIKKEDKNYVFTVYGYGHGVGMSQVGADYMAKQGYNYKEILNHYYSGCDLK